MRLIRITLGLTLALLLTGCAIFAGGESSMNAYEQYLTDGTVPSLKARYEGIFPIGVATSPVLLANSAVAETIAAHFSTLTCENEMKAESVMDRQATLRQGDPDRAALNFSRADTVLRFARDHGMQVRAHTLVWHSQTQRWFFAENWDSRADAPLADRDTMIRRMEHYIQDEMAYINETYPGLVFAWDVVNEGLEPAHGHPAGLRTEDSLWYKTIGDDYIELAFTFARKYAAEGQKLFYNDYNCYQKNKIGPLRTLLRDLRDKGLLDGLGMQSHIGIDSPSLTDYENALTVYASLGITIHVTELDVGQRENSDLAQMRLAVRYRTLFALLERLKTRAGIDIGSVTFWGLADHQSWLNNQQGAAYPLLFDAGLNPKAAFFGALQDASIPTMAGDAKLRDALDRLEPFLHPAEDSSGVTVRKPLSLHNPVMVQRFGADPWAMVYGDRVYLYMTGDEPVFSMNGQIQTNTYGNITTLRVLSSDDLVNWQDHGEVAAAGSGGAAGWASNSWAPCAAWKTIDGQDRFFLYFANSGGGIGVLTSDSPAGPFTDPLGKPLISRATPHCADVTWLFDPAVLLDEDGQAYLYFGGGIPEGQEAAPGTARAVKLGEDMISLAGEPVAIDAPWLFEDSGINRIGGRYLYSYCSNFQVPSQGSEQGFGSGEIVYMTSDSPLGPFVYAGRVLKNPGSYFGVGGNNHHCMFCFRDRWYITYHAATLDRDMGWNAGYRSVFVDDLRLDADGLPALSEGTLRGVEQVRPLDPYRLTEAETLASLAGADVRAEDGIFVQAAAAGGWIGLCGAVFGEDGAGSVTLRWRSEQAAELELLLDSPDADPAAVLSLPAAEDWQSRVFSLPAPVTGTHDLYFRFRAAGLCLDRWQFHRDEALSALAAPHGFRIGAPLSFSQLRDSRYLSLLESQFNSITATNEMKAYSLLDERASRRSADGMPVMNYTMADQMVGWAAERGIGVRGHVLVWDAYMCDWYFHEDYDPAKPYADRETICRRTESYITQVVTHFEEKFPGVVYCWDVVNEAVGDSAGEYVPGDPTHLRTVRSGSPNLFREYLGEDYVALAFLYARNAVESLGADIRLYYNDYNAYFPDKAAAILALADRVNHFAPDAEGQPRRLLDGIGMQGYIGGYGVQAGCLEPSHIGMIRDAILGYADAGYEVQITEMAVRNFDLSQAGRHAAFYGDLFRELCALNAAEGSPLRAVSIWGLTDTDAPRGNYVYNLNSPYGGLLDLRLNRKDAFAEVQAALRGE